MPGYITHYLLGRQARSLPVVKESYPHFIELIQKHSHVFNIGCQGPDVFLYLLQSNLNPKKKLGSIMHHQDTDKFFQCSLDYLTSPNSTAEKEIFCAYFAGMLCHYTLDCHAHPYIYWKTGYRLGHPEDLNYLAAHCQFESDLDAVMLEHIFKCTPSRFNRHRYIKLTEEEIQLLSPVLSEVITKSYFPSSSAYTTPLFMKLALKYMAPKVQFLNDQGGPKRGIIEFIERKTVKAPVLSCLFTVDHVANASEVLNLEKLSWHNPWNLSLTCHDSFLDVYRSALADMEKRLCLLAKLFESLSILSEDYDKTSLLKKQLLDELGDYSYDSGLSWRL